MPNHALRIMRPGFARPPAAAAGVYDLKVARATVPGGTADADLPLAA